MRLYLENPKDVDVVKQLVLDHSHIATPHIDKVGNQYIVECWAITDDQMIDLLLENHMEHLVGGA